MVFSRKQREGRRPAKLRYTEKKLRNYKTPHIWHLVTASHVLLDAITSGAESIAEQLLPLPIAAPCAFAAQNISAANLLTRAPAPFPRPFP